MTDAGERPRQPIETCALPGNCEGLRGVPSVPNEGLAPSGALDSAGHEIARRRGGGPR